MIDDSVSKLNQNFAAHRCVTAP